MNNALNNAFKLIDFVNVRALGAAGDGTADVTRIFARAVLNPVVRVPAGTYVLDSLLISQSVTFLCEPGSVFKRKAGADVASAGYNTMSGMFVVKKNGVVLRFVGQPTFDGNKQGQTAIEPGGAAIMVTVPDSVTADSISVYIENGRFINGTSDYILARGDDSRRRYKTLVTLVNPRFYDTLPGKGKGDPSTPSALGYSPTYVRCLDHVRLCTNDFYAEYGGGVVLGQYAPCAVLGTFAGSDYTKSGEAEILMFGHTELVGMGRAGSKYNDPNEWITNNGIGCIDMYGNGAELFIEHLTARNCRSPAARAKGSIKRFTVLSAHIEDSHRGLQVSPSSTGPCEAVVYVGSVSTLNGTIPAVEFTGSAVDDALRSVTLGAVNCYGAYTNPENLAGEGLVKIRNVAKFSADSIAAIGAPGSALTVEAVQRAHVRSLITNSSGSHAVQVTNGEQFMLNQFDIRNAAGGGIRIQGNTEKLVIEGGSVRNTIDYGVVNLNTCADATIRGVTVDTVSGLGRAFYPGLGNVVVTGNSARNAAVPFFRIPETNLREQQNSWNRREVHGGYSTTTSGSWTAGDVVWNSEPAAGGNLGWVCVASGSPGTWKSFGTVAA